MKGASSLSLSKHKAGSMGPETKDMTWMKMDRSSDNGKALGQQRLEVGLHVLNDKILATVKHSHLIEICIRMHRRPFCRRWLMLSILRSCKKHWEHVLGCWAGADDVEFCKDSLM